MKYRDRFLVSHALPGLPTENYHKDDENDLFSLVRGYQQLYHICMELKNETNTHECLIHLSLPGLLLF